VTVTLVIVGGQAQVQRATRGGAPVRDAACTLHVVPVPITPELPALGLPPPPSDDASPFWLFCGGALVEGFWAAPGDVIDLDALAAAEAARYVETVLGPSLSVAANPPAFALVGLRTWLWVDGWDGSTINVPVTAPWGASVTVTLALGQVDWQFGDGTSLTADLGRPWPEESATTHVYERLPEAGATPVSARVTIAASYSYAAVGPIGLAPLVTTVERSLPLRDAQAVVGRAGNT